MRKEIEPPFGWLDDDGIYLDELDISEQYLAFKEE